MSQSFLERIEAGPRGCWLWQGRVDAEGYGRFGRKLAHRMSYELHVGPIPDGLTLDHLCRNRNCVNPEHLEPVSLLENVRRGWRANRTHCSNGHAYSPENTHRSPKNGSRVCRLCSRDSSRRYKERRAARMAGKP